MSEIELIFKIKSKKRSTVKVMKEIKNLKTKIALPESNLELKEIIVALV